MGDAGKLLRDVGLAVGLAGLVIVSVLVVSGQLPPRGLVNGTVYDGGSSKSVPSLTLSFQEANGPRVYSVETDARGHFSVTVPPGKYRVKAPPSYVIYQQLFVLP